MAAMSAAQKALLCQEILSEIFEHLYPGSPNPDAFPRERAERRVRQRTLARLARVCHAFSVPALNVLWRVVDDLVALMSILPSFRMSYRGYYVSEIKFLGCVAKLSLV